MAETDMILRWQDACGIEHVCVCAKYALVAIG
jgi:hypothetical protein